MSITVDDFTEEFLYGFLEDEGEYIERIEKFLKKYPETQHSLIIDLLDLQWVAFVQQLSCIGEKTGSFDESKIEKSLAKLQIHSNARTVHSLPHRNMRNAMLRLNVLQILENSQWESDNL